MLTGLLSSPIVLIGIAAATWFLGRKNPAPATPGTPSNPGLPSLPIPGAKGMLINLALQVAGPLLKDALGHLFKGKLPIPVLDFLMNANMQDPVKRADIMRSVATKAMDLGQKVISDERPVGAAVPGTPKTP